MEDVERDRTAEAEQVYGTSDPPIPGVARVLGAVGRGNLDSLHEWGLRVIR